MTVLEYWRVWFASQPLIVCFCLSLSFSFPRFGLAEGQDWPPHRMICLMISKASWFSRSYLFLPVIDPFYAKELSKVCRLRIQIVGLNHHTYSRGSVTAVSSDTKDAPDVTANYFQDDRDVRVRLLAMREKDGKGWKGSTVDESNPLDEEVCTIQRGGLINQQSA